MAASKMTAPELREELESYDIPSRGLRKDIYKRLQVMRLAIKNEQDPVEVIIELEGEEWYLNNKMTQVGQSGGTSTAREWSEATKETSMSDEEVAQEMTSEYMRQQKTLRAEALEGGQVNWLPPSRSEEEVLEGMLAKLAEERLYDNPHMNPDTGFRFRPHEMSMNRRLDICLQIISYTVQLGGYPTSLDYECVMYHAVAARDMEAVRQLAELWGSRHRFSTCHWHPMRAPQAHGLNTWNAYREGPSGKKNLETITSNWAPAQCLDNSKFYQLMLDHALEREDGSLAKFVLYWMDDARWEVKREDRDRVTELSS